MSRRRRARPPAKSAPTKPAAEVQPRPAAEAQSSLTITRSERSGPLPPATELQAYENVLPGAADRIIAMAEGFAAHAQSLEAEAMSQARSEYRWGRFVAAAVVLAVLLTCIYALHLDKEEFAIVLGSSTIVALALVFIAGKVPDWLGKSTP